MVLLRPETLLEREGGTARMARPEFQALALEEHNQPFLDLGFEFIHLHYLESNNYV